MVPVLTFRLVSSSEATVYSSFACTVLVNIRKWPNSTALSSCVSQYCPHLIRPRSFTRVVITITRHCCSHTIRQKSALVLGNGPCVEMYAFFCL